MSFKDELEKILLKTTPCGCDESTIICIDCQDLINEAITSIIDLVDKELPKRKEKTFHGLIEKGTIQYAHLSGMKDGCNQAIDDMRSKLREGK